MLSEAAVLRILEEAQPCISCGRAPRLKDLAAQRGVSISTISRVLSGHTHSRNTHKTIRARGTRKQPEQSPHARVDNRPLREAFEASGMTVSLLAVRLGYERKGPTGRRLAPDTAPVRRSLGLGIFKGHRQTQMQVRTALRYVEALELDPVDVGL